MARPVKRTTEDFIAEAKLKHGDKYDYSPSVYLSASKKVEIVCPVHGVFLQRASNHLSGQGCKRCATQNSKRTLDSFLQEAVEVHGDTYDYSNVEFNDVHQKIIIGCRKHGFFEQTVVKHLSGQGCIRCKGREVWNTRDFIVKAHSMHEGLYDYSQVKYEVNNKKVSIRCLSCGEHFSQTPMSHLSGNGCPKCAGNIKLNEFEVKQRLFHRHDGEIWFLNEFTGMKEKSLFQHICGYTWSTTPEKLINKTSCPKCSLENRTMTSEEFLKRLNDAHNGTITCLDDFKNTHSRLNFRCEKCSKIYKSEPRNVLRSGCHNCANRRSVEEFNEILNEVSNGETKLVSEYKTGRDKVEVIHIPCGRKRWVTAADIIRHGGCPYCKSSKGNKLIFDFLESMNIPFEPEWRHDGCRDKIALPFDFYIQEKNLLIEFDGEQHFKVVDFWGGEEGYKKRKRRDRIKDEWAKNNNINLIRIRYDEDVYEVLNGIFNAG